MAIHCMHVACWILKAVNTHSEYVILIAFPLQQWLHECTSMLHYACIAFLVPTYTYTTYPEIGRGKKCSYKIAFLGVTLNFRV